MMYIFSFFFFLGPCILAGHFVFTWIVQTLIIVHMALVVYGQCLWLCIFGYVYGCVFMAMCMDVCLWLCVYGCVFMAMCLWVCMDVFLDVWMCFWLWVRGYVYGYRVSILREAWFNKYRGLPLLGARSHHHWDLLLHEAHFGRFWDLLLCEAHSSKCWVLLFHRSEERRVGKECRP